MNSKEYIYLKINELAQNFPDVKFSYQMDEESVTHFIEVLPKDFFEQFENRFVNEQNEIILEFIKKFPYEGLAFITEDDLFIMDQPEYVRTCTKDTAAIPNLSWNHKALSELLINFKPENIEGSLEIDQAIHAIEPHVISCTFSFTESNKHTNGELVTNNLPPSTIGNETAIVDDISDYQDYSLAA